MEEQRLQERRCIIGRRRSGGELSLLSDLPEYLLLEIMYRLPVKSVFKFKSVSKYWLSLISDPLFTQSYCSRRIINEFSSSSSRNKNNYNSPWTILYRYWCQLDLSPEDMWLHVLEPGHPIFRSPSFTLRFFTDHFKPPTPVVRYLTDDINVDGRAPVIVLAVSNDILLSAAHARRWHDSYYICNPLTKQWSALPKPPRIHEWVSVGFIAEPITGSFQLMRIVGYEGSSNIVNLEIFSSKTGKWKDKRASFDLPVQIFRCGVMVFLCHAVPCKSILHWMEYENRIIAYDTKEEDNNDEETIQCHLIDLPGDQDICGNKVIRGAIGVCQDQLRYCHVVNGSRTQNLRVWELRNSNNEQGEGYWSVLYRIRYEELNFSISERVRAVRMLAIHPLDPDIVYVAKQSPGRKDIMSRLNLRTKVCENLVSVGNLVNWKSVFTFVLPAWPTPIPQISSSSGVLEVQNMTLKPQSADE